MELSDTETAVNRVRRVVSSCSGALVISRHRANPAPTGSALGSQGGASAARYLRYEGDDPERYGLNHERRNLECLLREAHALGRLAALPPLRLAAAHNFGVERNWHWEAYFDLNASRLVDAAGLECSLPLVRRLPNRRLQSATLAPGERAPGSSATVELLVRRVRDPVYAKDAPLPGAVPGFRFRPSARVVELARPVIAALRERSPGGYAAAHVRRGDRLFGPMRLLTRPARIARRLRALGVSEGAVVFLLSDERDLAFWRTIAGAFDVVRHADFPALARLVPPLADGDVDNYLLYEVEKEVMRHARVRLETFPGPHYESSDAVLVPASVWAVARLARRTAHAMLRLARLVVGERGWARVCRIRDVACAWGGRKPGQR